MYLIKTFQRIALLNWLLSGTMSRAMLDACRDYLQSCYGLDVEIVAYLNRCLINPVHHWSDMNPAAEAEFKQFSVKFSHYFGEEA